MPKRALSFLFIILLLSCCSRQSSQQAQGYIEGRYTYMATSVSGILKELNVKRGSQVKQGQLLFVLDPQPESDAYEAALQTYNQNISAREAIAANLGFAKLTYERYKILVPKNAIEKSQLDSAKATYDATTAQLAQSEATIASSKATLAQAEWTKDQKMSYAPVDGVVFDIYYRLGEFTIANQSIMSLLAPTDIKAIFYVSEPTLGFLRLNDTVTVRCNGCDKAFPARVSFISPSAEYTPPLIYSNETNSKLVFRVEAQFAPEDAVHMHPGQPVEVTYQQQNRKN